MELRSLGVAAFLVLLVTGCQSVGVLAPLGAGYISGQGRSLGTYKNIKADIPELPPDKTRIYIYRPQLFLGMAARPAVIVNGKWLGGVGRSPSMLLVPGSVIIVDSPAPQNEAWLQRSKKEEVNNKLKFSSESGETTFLRFNLKPTYSYLTIADTNTAEKEIQSLKFMGHFTFSKNLDFVCSETFPTLKPDYVVIDREKAAYTVFLGVSEKKLNAVKDKIKNESDVDIVTWEKFLQEKDTYVGQQIIKDEYPESRTVEGIVELIRKFPGNPIGLTWNGGIAVTQNDYQHVLGTFRQFQEDPEKYGNKTNRNLLADPVSPQGHLTPLLCW